MKTILRISVLGLCFALMLMLDLIPLNLVPEADAVYGTRRRTARRTAVIVSSASQAETAQAEQETAEANARADSADAEAAAANQRADSAEAAAAAPAATTGTLPLGSVVTTLPAGCSKKVVDGVEYQFDGSNYYRTAFQGDQLVYVTAQP